MLLGGAPRRQRGVRGTRVVKAAARRRERREGRGSGRHLLERMARGSGFVRI
jgi:hypothetical protein